MKIDSKDALKELSGKPSHFLKVFGHVTLTVEVHKPDKVDLQQPHTRDEVYLILAGSGEFLNGGKRTSSRPGDFLYVPAGRPLSLRKFYRGLFYMGTLLWPRRRKKEITA